MQKNNKYVGPKNMSWIGLRLASRNLDTPNIIFQRSCGDDADDDDDDDDDDGDGDDDADADADADDDGNADDDGTIAARSLARMQDRIFF